MAGLGYQCGKEGPKLRLVGKSLLQKSAPESGKVAEIEIRVRITRQVNG